MSTIGPVSTIGQFTLIGLKLCIWVVSQLRTIIFFVELAFKLSEYPIVKVSVECNPLLFTKFEPKISNLYAHRKLYEWKFV